MLFLIPLCLQCFLKIPEYFFFFTLKLKSAFWYNSCGNSSNENMAMVEEGMLSFDKTPFLYVL